MNINVFLTVSESKRLIAKALATARDVRAACQEGKVIITPGTTNAYLAEELTGEAINKTEFVTGHTVPAGYDGPKPAKKISGYLIKGNAITPVSVEEAAQDLEAGDILFKGANAINYENNQAGVLIGHPTGGTMGATMGVVTAQRARLIHPVGLEKHVPGDLQETANIMKTSDGQGPALWVSGGEIFTEIEAIWEYCGVESYPVSAGGIGGAEGGIWLALSGESYEIEKVKKSIDEIKGEPAFLQA